MSDFKNFAMKGNIIDMATGVIIGTSFTKIVNSLVSEIITPFMSKLTGKVDLNDLFFALDGGTFSSIAEAKEAGAVTVNYGIFLSNITDFLIIAFTIFIFLRYTFNKRAKIIKEEPVIVTKTCPHCITEISLKATRCPNCTSKLVEK
ncbi:MAG: large conductance mechanosensitive channel protein MscL [Clostridia bacterium]|nr:large conductance mechanosensitive channel protein MscL [Clostridia bacterium]MDD4375456.1 large conductance mechanosensitive channel protein MscL [Clostridia bacterium]